MTLNVKLTNFATVPAASVTFQVTLTNPCVNATLTLPTMLVNVSIISQSGTAITQAFMPATDSVAASANIPDICGPRNYSINENYSFVTILPPAGSLS